MVADDYIRPRLSMFERWTAPVAVSALLTYFWFWLLAFGLTFESTAAPEVLQVVLEPPPPPRVTPPPVPPRAPPPKPPPPAPRRVLAQPAPPQPVEPVLPPQPVETPLAQEIARDPPPQETPAIAPPAPQAVVVPPEIKVVPLSRLTTLPTMTSVVKPEYPEMERNQQRQARVIAQFVVDDAGAVRDIKILQSAGAAFDTAVIDALRNAKFTPGMIGDRPAAARLRQAFEFELK